MLDASSLEVESGHFAMFREPVQVPIQRLGYIYIFQYNQNSGKTRFDHPFLGVK